MRSKSKAIKLATATGEPVFIKRQNGEDDASYGKRLLIDLAKWRRQQTEINYLHGKYKQMPLMSARPAARV